MLEEYKKKKKSPAAHHSHPEGMWTQAVWVHKCYSGAEFWASQHNSRNSRILLCGTETQKLNHLCKPAPSEAEQALSWQSPHTARKQCLVLKTLPIYFFFARK